MCTVLWPDSTHQLQSLGVKLIEVKNIFKKIPIRSSFLKEFVVVVSVGIGAIFVNNLFKVGKSLSVKFRNCLIPKPIRIVWNVGQCAISAEL